MAGMIKSLWARLWAQRGEVHRQLIQLKGWSTLVWTYWRILLPRIPPSETGHRESKEIVMLVVSTLRVDPRVEREARALAAAGYDVKIIFPDFVRPYFGDDPFSWGDGVTFKPVAAAGASYIMFAPWLFGDIIHAAACEERPFAFHCHDLSTAMIGLSAARKVKSVCVCDFHEWWSENVTWDRTTSQWISHPPLPKRLYKAAERLCMRKAHHVVTVCDSIAQALREESSSAGPVTIVRNIPPAATGNGAARKDLRAELDVPGDRKIILYQGGVGSTRNLEAVIEAMAAVHNALLVIRGPSIEAFSAGYMDLAQTLGIVDRVVCLPPVPSADVVAAARGADVGLYTVLGLGLNFEYALPNKVFEYLAAGLPLLVPHFPEVKALVEQYRIGLTFDPASPSDIARTINLMVEDEEVRRGYAANITAALTDLDAGREWQKLVALYDELRTAGSQ